MLQFFYSFVKRQRHLAESHHLRNDDRRIDIGTVPDPLHGTHEGGLGKLVIAKRLDILGINGHLRFLRNIKQRRQANRKDKDKPNPRGLNL